MLLSPLITPGLWKTKWVLNTKFRTGRIPSTDWRNKILSSPVPLYSPLYPVLPLSSSFSLLFKVPSLMSVHNYEVDDPRLTWLVVRWMTSLGGKTCRTPTEVVSRKGPLIFRIMNESGSFLQEQFFPVVHIPEVGGSKELLTLLARLVIED